MKGEEGEFNVLFYCEYLYFENFEFVIVLRNICY